MPSTQDLLTRAISEVVPLKVAQEKLDAGKPIRIYLGIDPTGATLHLGHAVVLRKLRAFQDAGHEVILLIGSFTAMIGDPSGRDKQREPLTREQVTENFRTYTEQAGKVLDMSKLQIRQNHEWLEKLTTEEILKLASNFTVQQMLRREMFQKRMREETEIAVTEFLYPLLVGYDSVTLDVDCELGGNDQLFNMLCGRTLQKAYGKREKFVMTTKLLEGTDGRKMSKTYKNCIWLDDSAKEMYGKILSVKDALIPTYMECCTDIPMAEIEDARVALQGSAISEAQDGKVHQEVNPKTLKMRLAREIVTLYHGKDATDKAEAEFQSVFSQRGAPEDVLVLTVPKGTNLVDVLLQNKVISSKTEARRLIEQRGLHLGNGDDSKPVEDLHFLVGNILAPERWAEGVIVKVGKRRFVRIKTS